MRFAALVLLPPGMASSPSMHRSTKPSMLRRRGACSSSSSERSCSNRSPSRCVLSVLLPVVLLLLRGGSVESATQVGPVAGTGAHRRFAGPVVPGIAASAETASAAGGEKRREGAGGRRRSRGRSTSCSFLAKDDDGNRLLHMPRIGGIRRPDWLVRVSAEYDCKRSWGAMHSEGLPAEGLLLCRFFSRVGLVSCLLRVHIGGIAGQS